MITSAFVKKLLRLSQGEALPASSLKGKEWELLREEEVFVTIAHKSKRSYKVADQRTFMNYVQSHYNIDDLEKAYEVLSDEKSSRATLVELSGDSKLQQKRTFTGFPVDVCEPLEVLLKGEKRTLTPGKGMFTYVADYMDFKIPENVCVIGIENAENFKAAYLMKSFFQRYIPNGSSLLFVSRYPQNGDLVRWLESVPNRYLHFGDLDLAGIHIFQSEFESHLGKRASFLIPDTYEEDLREKGIVERYDVQLSRYGNIHSEIPELQALIDSIHKYHCGYDQEGYIYKYVDDRENYFR